MTVWRVAAFFSIVRNWHLLLRYRKKLGRWPNLLFPRTHNERMQWRKIFDHDPRFVTLCDKLAVKAHFRRICPELDTAEVLWHGTDPALIPEELLTGDTVLKVNNGCQKNIFPAVAKLPPEQIRATLAKWLRTRPSRSNGEWSYHGIAPRIFVERRIPVPQGTQITELNFDVFNGTVFSAFVITGKEFGPYRYGIFGPDGARWPVTVASMPDPEAALPADFAVPPSFKRAGDLAARLGQGFDNLRVDFMSVGDQLFGCEVTIYSTSGFGNVFNDPATRARLDAAWDLRNSWFLNTTHTGWRKTYARALNRFEEANFHG